jgi:hypothetical protein
MVSVQTPQPMALRTLGDLQRKHRGKISRCDIAFDVIDGADLDWVNSVLLLRRRKPSPTHREVRTTYFVPHAHKNRSPRDLVTYDTKPSKLWGTPNAVHIELRLRGAAIANDNSKDYIDLDPSKLFHQHIRVVKPNDLKLRLLREMLQDERRRHLERGRRHKPGSVEDRYRSNLIRKIEAVWARNECQFEYVQRVHDQFPDLNLKTDRNMVSLPTCLTWGASRYMLERSAIKPAIENIMQNIETPPDASFNHGRGGRRTRELDQRKTKERPHGQRR